MGCVFTGIEISSEEEEEEGKLGSTLGMEEAKSEGESGTQEIGVED